VTTTASDAQIRFLVSLLKEREAFEPEADLAQVFQALQAALSSKAASKAIDIAKALPRPQVAPVAAAAASYRTNRYAGTCARCGGHVGAEEGRLEGPPWKTYHLDGKCAEVVVTVDPTLSPSASLHELVDGYYAIPSATGNNDLDFFYVSTNKGFYNSGDKGKRSIKRFLGGSQKLPLNKNLWAGIVERITAAGPFEAQQLAGRTIGICSRCGRDLTDEESRAFGMGPTCRGK
jgi:hypothetical protein